MKHISSKLIWLTIGLTAGLLLITAFLSFSILKKESRAYTFQGQLLQAQLFSETLKSELSRTQDVAGELIHLQPAATDLQLSFQNLFTRLKATVPGLSGFGVKPVGASSWFEFPSGTVQTIPLPNELGEKNILIPVAAGSSEMIDLLAAKNALLAVRIDLKKSLLNCAGLNSAFFNQRGEAIYYCNPESKPLFDRAKDVLREVYGLSLESGTLERAVGEDAYLWTYAQVGDFGRVVSFSTTKAANRPALALASRVLTLILMAIGGAVVASILFARKLTGPIEQVTRATQKIANGDFDTRIDIHTQDETRTLANAVEAMAEKIKQLLVAQVEKAKLDAQLEMAGAVQKTLIPLRHLSFDGLQIESYYQTADQCGGDWWGYVKGSQKIGVLVGDVSGHGYASALLVATTRGFLSMIQERIDRESDSVLNPSEILGSLNSVIFDASHGELNMTAMCIVFDQVTGEFELSSAGHHAAYQLGEGRPVTAVRGYGPRLGEMRILASPLDNVPGHLLIGEKLVLYTDGMQELGSLEQPLGRKGFKKFLADHASETALQLTDAVDSELQPLNEGRPLIDDLTFVVLERSS